MTEQLQEKKSLGNYWPGIQLYYPPIKYSPSKGVYEDMEQASARMKKHAHFTNAHTLIFDLEDGCRQKKLSRELLRQELPLLRKMNERVTIAIRVNSFRTEDQREELLTRQGGVGKRGFAATSGDGGVGSAGVDGAHGAG